MITRRDLLRGVAGTVGLLGWPPGHASGEPPPETTRLRLYQTSSICAAPQYIVGELLKAEGFSDIKYVKMTTAGISKALASGEVDVSLHFVGPLANSSVHTPWRSTKGANGMKSAATANRSMKIMISPLMGKVKLRSFK